MEEAACDDIKTIERTFGFLERPVKFFPDKNCRRIFIKVMSDEMPSKTRRDIPMLIVKSGAMQQQFVAFKRNSENIIELLLPWKEDGIEISTAPAKKLECRFQVLQYCNPKEEPTAKASIMQNTFTITKSTEKLGIAKIPDMPGLDMRLMSITSTFSCPCEGLGIKCAMDETTIARDPVKDNKQIQWFSRVPQPVLLSAPAKKAQLPQKIDGKLLTIELEGDAPPDGC